MTGRKNPAAVTTLPQQFAIQKVERASVVSNGPLFGKV